MRFAGVDLDANRLLTGRTTVDDKSSMATMLIFGLTDVCCWQTMSAMGIDNPMYLIVGDNDAGPEEEQLESIKDLRPTGGRGARVTLRLPPRLVEYLAGLAASNGRSFAAECQAALEVHETLSRLSALLDQELQEERKQLSGGVHGVTGRSAERVAATFRAEVDRIWTQSFATRAQKRTLAEMLLAGR